QLASSEGREDELREKNETLQRRVHMLGQKARGQSTVASVADAALAAELQLSQQEAARLAGEKEQAERDSAALAKQLAQVRAEKEKEVGKLKAAVAAAEAGAGVVGAVGAGDMEGGPSPRAEAEAQSALLRLQEECRALQAAAKEREAEVQREAGDRQQLQDRVRELEQAARGVSEAKAETPSTNTTAASISAPASAPISAGITAGVQVGDESLLGTHLLNSYAKADGSVVARDVQTALQDLMIDITTEQAARLVRDMGPSSRGGVLVSSVVDYFKGEMGPMLQARKAEKAAGAGADKVGAGAGLRRSVDLGVGAVGAGADAPKTDKVREKT
ncbi:hypothetical protein B484DRAFT_408698, partial [Ochromonadaceae sp. CCMP2298]